MNNGIKPTRLWHLTGRKHFWSMIADRYDGLKHRQSHEQREKGPFVNFVLLTVAAVAGVGYAFGRFSPERYHTTIVRPDDKCTDKFKPCPKYLQRIKKQPEKPPCPCSEEAEACTAAVLEKIKKSNR